jgi:uncharacterized protein YjbI with pentapeptide repeats
MKDVKLKTADLRGADLDGVALREVDLAGAKMDLSQAAQFARAYGATVA